MISTILNSINTIIHVLNKYKEVIKGKMQIIEAIEDKKLMKSYILGNNLIYGSKTKYKEFIKIMNEKLSIGLAADSQRSNGKVYSSKY